MEKIALFGYSGHAFVVADAIIQKGNSIVGYYNRNKSDSNPFKLKYLGDEQNEDTLFVIDKLETRTFVCIGDNIIRQKLYNLLTAKGFTISTVIHPLSLISALATVGEGSFVAAGAKINALASVKKGTIINTGAIVEHECEIGNFTHIAPGAILAGNVKIGEGSFVGAGAVVKQGINIGRNVIVGAGAVVLENIPDYQTWVGNPAKELRR